MPNYNESILYFSGTQEELQEQLDGKIFPVGTVLNINETDTDRTKIFVITDLKSFSYDTMPYSETAQSAATEDTRTPHDRIDELEERITRLEEILSMIATKIYVNKDG